MGIQSERFVCELPQDVYCILCSQVLDNPVEVIECGHFVCSICWEKWKENNQTVHLDAKITTCPYCGVDTNLNRIRKSKLTWNLIQNMNVYCEKKSEGCESVYKLGYDDIHKTKCLYAQGKNTDQINAEKCATCNLSSNGKSHSCIKELLQKLKSQSTEILNLDHEKNRLAFKLTTCEKELIEERSELEGQFFQDSLKYNKEIRDLRTRLACLQGELARKKGQVSLYVLCSYIICAYPIIYANICANFFYRIHQNLFAIRISRNSVKKKFYSRMFSISTFNTRFFIKKHDFKKKMRLRI